MKKFNKIISVILVAVMALSIFAVCGSAEVTTTIPTIIVRGQGTYIYDSEGNQVYDFDPPEGYVSNLTNTALPLFTEALKTGDYSEWSKVLVDGFGELYEKLRLDGDGNPRYGTHIVECQYTDAEIYQRASWGTNYDLSRFQFCIDWRLDPFEEAEKLNHRIQVVKAATGADKVNLVVRCQGNSVVAAYLAAYGSDDIANLVSYVSTLYGLEPISAVFSGNLDLDAESIIEYYNEKHDFVDGIGDKVMVEFLDNTIGFLQSTYGLEAALAMLKPMLRKLYNEAVYECVLMSYGTFPGMWTCVSVKDYEKAKAGVFKGHEEEYAGLIAKLDRYHNEVALHVDDLFKAAEANGCNVSVIAKYGDFWMIPTVNTSMISDDAVSLWGLSYGATTTSRKTVFSDSYIAKAEANGTAKYISPDKMVDASTCLFPDKTWILENCHHSNFPAVMDTLCMTLCASNGEMTVWNNENYPQYMHLEGDGTDYWASFVPLTEENCMKVEKDTVHTKKNVKEQVLAFLKSLITMLLRLLNKKGIL